MTAFRLPEGVGDLDVLPEEHPAESVSRRSARWSVWVRLGLGIVLAAGIWHYLREPWAPILWVALLVVAASHYFTGLHLTGLHFTGRRAVPAVLLVTVVAAIARWIAIDHLPHGPYLDEVLTYFNTTQLYRQPFDLFGQVILSRTGWVETSHLYLYCNWLILEIFGTGYFGLKMISVVPGIFACTAVYLICRELWQPHIALIGGLLFAVSIWPMRISRYGWDVSFMVMAFAFAIWLLVRACRSERLLVAWLSGSVAGICLYSYVAARVCLGSLALFLLVEWALRRDRLRFRRLIAFTVGGLVTALPLFCYWIKHPAQVSVRTKELSIFAHDNWPELLAQNIWGHAGMFHFTGGLYARDNFPGMPMMDVISGLLLVAGVLWILRRLDQPLSRLLLCTLVVNSVGGVFSTSEEGPPYVYRVAAMMVPAFLIVTTGMQWFGGLVAARDPNGRLRTWLPVMLVVSSGILNLWMYFGSEPDNLAASRITGYEVRVVLEEFDAAEHPAFLVGRDVFARAQPDHYPGEPHPEANPTFLIGPDTSLATVYSLSKLADPRRPLPETLRDMRRYLLPKQAVGGPLPTPCVLIFNARDPALVEQIRSRPGAGEIRYREDIIGRKLLGIVTIR